MLAMEGPIVSIDRDTVVGLIATELDSVLVSSNEGVQAK